MNICKKYIKYKNIYISINKYKFADLSVSKWFCDSQMSLLRFLVQ